MLKVEASKFYFKTKDKLTFTAESIHPAAGESRFQAQLNFTKLSYATIAATRDPLETTQAHL